MKTYCKNLQRSNEKRYFCHRG